VAEETGLRVELESLIAIAEELVFSAQDDVHYRKRCSFFLANVIGASEPSEPDHELRWMAPHEALRELHHEVQRWAVRKAIEDRESHRSLENHT
jgi:8-oxo-dGTP diphosphatase